MRLWASIALCFVSISSLAQVNLVPNGSFEIFTDCPDDPFGISSMPAASLVQPWRKVGGGGGVQYFNSCDSADFSVPHNYVGSQSAMDGVAYAASITWINEDVLPGHNPNFFGTPIAEPLVAGKMYTVSFCVSLMDSVWYASRNLGIHFSVDQPVSDYEQLLTLQPQVSYNDTAFLSNKTGWDCVTGNMVAQGGENFMTIGNFDGFDNTEVSFVGGAIPPPNSPYFWEGAVYYLDNVSVVEDTSTLVNSLEQEESSFSVYPNPASDVVKLQVQSSSYKGHRLQVFDSMGREIHRYALNDRVLKLDVGSWENGIYTVNLWDNKGTISRQKLIVQH